MSNQQNKRRRPAAAGRRRPAASPQGQQRQQRSRKPAQQAAQQPAQKRRRPAARPPEQQPAANQRRRPQPAGKPAASGKPAAGGQRRRRRPAGKPRPAAKPQPAGKRQRTRPSQGSQPSGKTGTGAPARGAKRPPQGKRAPGMPRPKRVSATAALTAADLDRLPVMPRGSGRAFTLEKALDSSKFDAGASTHILLSRIMRFDCHWTPTNRPNQNGDGKQKVQIPCDGYDAAEQAEGHVCVQCMANVHNAKSVYFAYFGEVKRTNKGVPFVAGIVLRSFPPTVCGEIKDQLKAQGLNDTGFGASLSVQYKPNNRQKQAPMYEVAAGPKRWKNKAAAFSSLNTTPESAGKDLTLALWNAIRTYMQTALQLEHRMSVLESSYRRTLQGFMAGQSSQDQDGGFVDGHEGGYDDQGGYDQGGYDAADDFDDTDNGGEDDWDADNGGGDDAWDADNADNADGDFQDGGYDDGGGYEGDGGDNGDWGADGDGDLPPENEFADDEDNWDEDDAGDVDQGGDEPWDEGDENWEGDGGDSDPYDDGSDEGWAD